MRTNYGIKLWELIMGTNYGIKLWELIMGTNYWNELENNSSKGLCEYLPWQSNEDANILCKY